MSNCFRLIIFLVFLAVGYSRSVICYHRQYEYKSFTIVTSRENGECFIGHRYGEYYQQTAGYWHAYIPRLSHDVYYSSMYRITENEALDECRRFINNEILKQDE